LAPRRGSGPSRSTTLSTCAYNGRSSRWFHSAVRKKAGRITAAGMTKEVTFEPVEGPINDCIDDAYRAKYRDSHVLESGRPREGITGRRRMNPSTSQTLLHCRRAGPGTLGPSCFMASPYGVDDRLSLHPEAWMKHGRSPQPAVTLQAARGRVLPERSTRSWRAVHLIRNQPPNRIWAERSCH